MTTPDKETLDRWQRTITEAADGMVKAGTKDASLLGFLRMTAAYIADQPKRDAARERHRQLGREHYDRYLRKKPRSK